MCLAPYFSSGYNHFLINLISISFFACCTSHEKNEIISTDLAVTANGRYFINKETGNPFFYMGDTAWWLWASLKKEELIEYLEDTKRQGFNVIQLHLTPHRPNDYANAYGVKPYGDDNNNALDVVDAYWEYVTWSINQAHKRDLYCAIIVGHPLRKGDRREPPFAFSIDDLNSAYESGWLIGNRLKTYNDNIIWIGGWDLNPVKMGIIDNIRVQMEGIADAVNGIYKYDNSADWSTTFMTLHTCPNGMNNSSSDYYHTDPWLDFNMIQTYGNLHKAIENISHDRELIPVKPTILVEGAYEGTGAGNYGQADSVKRYRHFQNNKWTFYCDEFGEILPWHARYQAYQTVFSGAAGTGYGHRALVTNAWVPESRMAAYKADGRDDQKHLKSLMISKDFFQLRPMQDLILDGDGGTETSHVRSIIAGDGSYAYIYATDGRPFTINLAGITTGKKIKVQWYNPKNGKYSLIGFFEKQVQLFSNGPTGVDHDIVLMIEGIE